MTIRGAVPSDAAAIARIEAAAAGHPWTQAAVASTLALPTTLGLVAADSEVVGHLLASAVLDEGEVLTVAVHPSQRRRGLGRSLLRACRAAWADSGVRRGFLEVRADNAPALALYLSEGWERAGGRVGYYADGTDALLLSLEIG